MEGKLHVYRRENSPYWQCATYLSGRNYRQSTKETNVAFAREFARDWYLDRVAEDRLRKSGKLPSLPEMPVVVPERVTPKRPGEKTFREAAAVFEKEFEAMTLGERNAHYVAGKGRVIRLYLNPFFGDLPISEVSAGRIQDYRLHRVTPPEEPQRVRLVSEGQERIGKARAWKRPSRQTLHHEMVCLRQILKTANRKGWISALPDMSNPYRASGKVSSSFLKKNVPASALTITASAAFQPKVENMKAVSHCQVAATMRTGGAPKLVSVPPIDTLTNNTPSVAYLKRADSGLPK